MPFVHSRNLASQHKPREKKRLNYKTFYFVIFANNKPNHAARFETLMQRAMYICTYLQHFQVYIHNCLLYAITLGECDFVQNCLT
jgi:hypothetical protein